jgi:alpha-amylase
MTAHHLMPNAIKQRNRNKIITFAWISQVYYGDESARSLVIEGTQGDATYDLYEWDAIKSNPETQKTLLHWQN